MYIGDRRCKEKEILKSEWVKREREEGGGERGVTR